MTICPEMRWWVNEDAAVSILDTRWCSPTGKLDMVSRQPGRDFSTFPRFSLREHTCSQSAVLTSDTLGVKWLILQSWWLTYMYHKPLVPSWPTSKWLLHQHATWTLHRPLISQEKWHLDTEWGGSAPPSVGIYIHPLLSQLTRYQQESRKTSRAQG